MRVFYDHQIFCEQTFGGISRYFYELIIGGKNLHLYDPVFDVKFSNNVFKTAFQPAFWVFLEHSSDLHFYTL